MGDCLNCGYPTYYEKGLPLQHQNIGNNTCRVSRSPDDYWIVGKDE